MRLRTVAATLVLALSAAPASAQEVSYDYDTGTDFSRFRTYAWVSQPGDRDDMTHRRIVAAVDSQLALKGLTRAVEGSRPDVLVSYHVGVARNLQVSTWGNYRGPASTASARVEQVPTAVFAVELLEPSSGIAVWRAMSAKDIDFGASPEKRTRNINKAAEKLFKHYPAAPKKNQPDAVAQGQPID